MLNLLPLAHAIGKHIGRLAARPLQAVAKRSWEIAAGEIATPPPAVFLPNQLERVTGWAFADEHPGKQMLGGVPVAHAPTRGYEIEHVWLMDGVLYKDDACLHLHPRLGRWPALRVDHEVERGAVYCTPGGNRYFGQWLMDDCLAYPLATAEGLPVTTNLPMGPHVPAYEKLFGMRPIRVPSAHLHQLVIFDDVGQNRHKRDRFRAMGDKLRAEAPAAPHPGVFILRGRTGQRRILRNEMELAFRLRDQRGFRIVDPESSEVSAIVSACAGARTVVGVEGSALLHGILVLPPGGAVVTLQPPNRFVGLLKHLTDRDGQYFAFVVGTPEGNAFRIDGDELERTLDLLPREGGQAPGSAPG